MIPPTPSLHPLPDVGTLLYLPSSWPNTVGGGLLFPKAALTPLAPILGIQIPQFGDVQVHGLSVPWSIQEVIRTALERLSLPRPVLPSPWGGVEGFVLTLPCANGRLCLHHQNGEIAVEYLAPALRWEWTVRPHQTPQWPERIPQVRKSEREQLLTVHAAIAAHLQGERSELSDSLDLWLRYLEQAQALARQAQRDRVQLALDLLRDVPTLLDQDRR